jgi:hypothetical protein
MSNILLLFIFSQLKFPQEVNDNDFIDLVRKLLEKSITKRIYFYDDIKKHPFFKTIDFETLENLYLKPPYLPKLEKMKLKDFAPMEDILKYLSENVSDVQISGKKMKLPKDWDEMFVI